MNATDNGVNRYYGNAPRGNDDGDIQLDEVLLVFRRHKRLALSVFTSILLIGALHTAWQRAKNPVFQGGFRLLVSDPINTEDRSDSDIESLARSGTGSTNVSATLIQVLSSPVLLSPIEQKLGLPAGVLAPTITIPKAAAGMGNPGVLDVSLQWRDPVQGQAILEKISQEYLAYSLRQRQEKLTQGLAFLDQQAPELQARVAALQNQLAEFRQRSGFVEPLEQAAAIKEQQLALITQRKALEQEQARLEGQAAALRRGHFTTSALQSSTLQGSPSSMPSFPQGQGPPGTSIGPSSAPAATGPSTLSDDLFQVERQLAEAEATYTDDAPQVRELRAKRDRLRPLLQRQQLSPILASLNENRSQLAEIRLQEEQLARQFQGNPLQMKQYEALEQQLVVARDSLTSYIKARESFRLQVAQRTVPWSLMTKPSFGSQPVKPSVSRGLLTSAMFGAVAGLGVAFARDRMDHVFRNPREIKDELPVPLLGVVPHLPGREGLTVTQSLELLSGGDRFAIKESMRNIFTNFRLLRADKPVRLVAMTSSTQGEGKSTTTALFAQTLAQVGQRVLLVDADMRRPMLHRYLGTDNTEGFSSLLTDPQLDAITLVRHLQDGLDLLTAGPIPPDPTQLLSSVRCEFVLQMIRNLPGYDLVLFDTPPAFILSDPVLLAEHLDGLIFLVGLSRVNRDLPALAIERMADTGVDVLGVLANQPVSRKVDEGYYGYGYGYRYRYGYGYGYGYGEKTAYGAYAKSAERRHPEAPGEDDATDQAHAALREPGRSRNGKGSKTPIAALRSGSRRVIKWLDGGR